MGKIKITEKKLLKQYTKIVDEIADECEWKTHFTGEEVCGIVFGILTKNDIKPKICVQDFYKMYSDRVDEVSKTDAEWRNNYGIPEIIHLIYDLLEKKYEIIW